MQAPPGKRFSRKQPEQPWNAGKSGTCRCAPQCGPYSRLLGMWRPETQVLNVQEIVGGEFGAFLNEFEAQFGLVAH